MDGMAQVIVIPLLVVVVMLLALTPVFVFSHKKAEEQRKIREELITAWKIFVKDGQEITSAAFEEIRLLTLKQYMQQSAEQYECEGAFVIAVENKKRFYYGESKKIFNAINLQIKGRGNKELFDDVSKSRTVLVKALAFCFLSLDERKNIKERLTKEYVDAGFTQYGKKKQSENKPSISEKSEQNEASYLNHGLSVTRMVGIVRQPKGGFISPSKMEKIVFENQNPLSLEENVHPSLVGMAVDYMSRFLMGDKKENAFEISLKGAQMIGQSSKAKAYLDRIKGNDNNSIVAALKLVSYDCVFRAGPHVYVDQSNMLPSNETILNISEMLNRTRAFWKLYGPITVYGPTFDGGYTKSVSTGDGDYLTKDTIWDYKVSKDVANSKQTLQLLLYYLLGIHSVHSHFKDIKYIGIYNPRLNIAYRYPISSLSSETIEYIEKEIIGY